MVEGILAQAVRNRPDDCINHGHGPRPTSARRIVVLETEDGKKFSQGGEQGGTAVTAMSLATPRPRRGVVSCPVLLHVQAEQVAPSEAQVGGDHTACSAQCQYLPSGNTASTRVNSQHVSRDVQPSIGPTAVKMDALVCAYQN